MAHAFADWLHCRTDTPLGPLTLARTPSGLCGAWFDDQRDAPAAACFLSDQHRCARHDADRGEEHSGQVICEQTKSQLGEQREISEPDEGRQRDSREDIGKGEGEYRHRMGRGSRTTPREVQEQKDCKGYEN